MLICQGWYLQTLPPKSMFNDPHNTFIHINLPSYSVLKWFCGTVFKLNNARHLELLIKGSIIQNEIKHFDEAYYQELQTLYLKLLANWHEPDKERFSHFRH